MGPRHRPKSTLEDLKDFLKLQSHLPQDLVGLGQVVLGVVAAELLAGTADGAADPQLALRPGLYH